MRILHVPFCFYPDPVGGTEVYVAALARAQNGTGATAMIAAPGRRAERYRHGDLDVYRFPVGPALALRELYGEGDRHAAGQFEQVLDVIRPDVVHLHAFTSAVSTRLADAVKRRGLPLLLTYHTPTVSCQRGTLLRWGTVLCDGQMRRRICTMCVLQGSGISRPLSTLIGLVPRKAGEILGAAGLAGGPWTALRMSELVNLRHDSVRALFQQVDSVVALCQWSRELLIRNGVPETKVTLSRHGLDDIGSRGRSCRGSQSRGLIKLAFLGRANRTKGLDVLISAIRSQPSISMRLDVYAVTQGTADETYLKTVRSAAGDDNRIAFCSPVRAGETIELLRAYDALVVPSQWFETGPLVVLEAFAAGIPVIGSNLGGIGELIEHEVNGLLVEPESVPGWAAALVRIASEEDLLQRLRARVPEPRRMSTVAEEMIALYRSFVTSSGAPPLTSARTSALTAEMRTGQF